MPYTIKPDQGYDTDVESLDYLKGHVDTGDRWTLNFGPQHPRDPYHPPPCPRTRTASGSPAAPPT